MLRKLFLHILNGLSARYLDLQQCWDEAGKPGLSPQQKCTTAIRQLAYEGAADIFDEYLHVADTTGHDCLKQFCKGMIQTFGPTYLQKPTAQDCQLLLNWHGRVQNFSAGRIQCRTRGYNCNPKTLVFIIIYILSSIIHKIHIGPAVASQLL